MLGSPNQGARFYNPELPADRAVRARPPHVRRLRAVDPVPDDEQGVGRQHDPGRPDRLHVCRQQLVSVHAVQRALGAHADRQRRQLHRRRRRRLRGDDPQGQVEGRVSEHHLRSRRRQRVGHRARVDFGRALPQPRLPDHLLRQRAVRQHRHPGLVAHAVRRHDDVLAARADGAGSEEAVPEGSRAHDGGRPSALLRGDRERRLSDRPDEQGAQGAQLQGRRRS